VFIKIKYLIVFLKRLIILSFLFIFRESICSWVVLVRFIPELAEICKFGHINLRSRSFFFRSIFCGCLLSFCLSFAFDLTFSISHCAYHNLEESIYEIDENGSKQEAGEKPRDLQLEIGQQRLVVYHLGVKVVREHEGKVQIA
jgi:hypothetical protein